MAEKKRYHGTHHHRSHGKKQNFMDRMHEHEGAEHHDGHHMRHYSGKHDSHGMIDNDHFAIANMPPQASMKFWPKSEDSLLMIPSDDIHGVDMQIDQAVRAIEANRTTRKN